MVLAALCLGACGGGGGRGGGATTVVESVAVPDLSGLRAEEATARICAAGLDPAPPRVRATGRREDLTPAQIDSRPRVVASRPPAGARVARATPVVAIIDSPAGVALAFRVQSCDSVSAPAPWTIDLADVELGPTGIGLALHPTSAPIAISVDSELPLRVCPADPLGRPVNPAVSSFGRRWTECRALGAGVVELPRTDGRSHVGIRILTADGGPGTVGRLRVRWRCRDAYVQLRDPAGSTPAPVPRCAAAP